MAISVLTSSNLSAHEAGWQNEFLTWFARLGKPLLERRLGIGDFRYYQFATLVNTRDGSIRAAHGRSLNRRLAAIKCAAEAIEREIAVQYFAGAPEQVHTQRFIPGSSGIQLLSASRASLPPQDLRTSSGWAVHGDLTTAQDHAASEALERHLLLKSFLRFGWSGFSLRHEIHNPEISLYFLTSRFSVAGQIASLVAARSPLYPGVAFGHSIGMLDDVEDFQFWETPTFEAIDKILSLNGRNIDLSEQSSWIRQEIKTDLESPFDPALLRLGENLPLLEGHAPVGHIQSFDIGAARNLGFSLYAAFAWGGTFIPLYHRDSLGVQSGPYLENILSQHDIFDLPERHPIT